jgi:hypothetical protein
MAAQPERRLHKIADTAFSFLIVSKLKKIRNFPAR